jgi:hypothetical protein
LVAGTAVGAVVVLLVLFVFLVPIFPDTTSSVSLFGTSISVTLNASLSFLIAHCGSYDGARLSSSFAGSISVGSGYTLKCG